MERSSDANGDPVGQTLEHEFDLVRSAIALVASGGASNVSLGSLRFGDQLIEAASRLALASRVRITRVWSTDESGAGLSFEKMPDE